MEAKCKKHLNSEDIKMANGWKIFAIILLIILIIENILFAGIFYLGVDTINKENTCQFEECASHDSFYFDMTDNMCYCYKDNEIVKSRRIT